MVVIVDTREPYEEVFDRLAETGVEHRLETLNGPEHPKADFLVGPDRQLAIQRKSVNDFVGSLDTLKDDLFKLRENHEMSALLVEGDWSVAGDRIALRRGRSVKQTIPISTWHNFIVSQQLRGTMYLRTNSLTETCRLLACLDDYVGGEMRPPVQKAEDPAVMLQLVPGVGPETAANLVDYYGTPYEALVNVGQWDEVPGIGEKRRDNAVAWFKGGPDG